MHSIIPQMQAAREDVSVLFSEFSAGVVELIEVGLAPEDRGEAEDLAQDVWLGLWGQVVVTGEVVRPGSALLDLINARVAEFYGRPVAAVEAVAA